MPRSFPGSSDDVARPTSRLTCTAPDADRLTVARGTQPEIDLEVRRSHFLARAARAGSEEEARGFISSVRATYPDARHHCSAFIVALPGANPVERSSDDGEPSGTAGTPMLEVVRANGLTDVAVVVTRYFGGTLLGTGGLVRAYSEATARALSAATQVRLVTHRLWDVELDVAEAGRIEAEMRSRGIRVEDMRWGTPTVLTLSTPAADGEAYPALTDTLATLTQGRSAPVPAGSRVVEVPVPA